jgi:hypothetical protein
MIAGKPRWVLWAIGTASLVRVAAGPALAEKPSPPHPRKSIGAPPAAHWRDDDSQRQEAILRARDEIRRDPNQKKFILFRYGLHEDDLR